MVSKRISQNKSKPYKRRKNNRKYIWLSKPNKLGCIGSTKPNVYKSRTYPLFHGKDLLKEGLILTEDQEKEFFTGGKKIILKPIWRWLLESEE